MKTFSNDQGQGTKDQGPSLRLSLSRSLPLGLLSTVLCLLSSAPLAHAQWQSTTYTLKGGWNAIYLHGDATYATIETILPVETNILEVWRWNPNPSQTQFSSSTLIPHPGTPEWSIWKRGETANTLLSLTGQAAYLVKCSGASTITYTVPIVHKVQPPRSTWVRNGANLLGFPSRNNSGYPPMTNYFATFPVAIATNTKIYKYVGGDLGPSNPIQVFSTSAEPLDRTQAYWFEAAVVSNFYAPLEISPSNLDGLIYGRTGSLVSVRVRNRTAAAVTLTVDKIASAAAPAGQDQITGQVPLTYRTFNSTTAQYEFSAITAPLPVVVEPQSTVELFFGLNRALMSGATDALYASLLRFTDGGNLMDVYLPVSARVTSLSGLWIGDVAVSQVLNRTPAQRFTVDVTRTTDRTLVALTAGAGATATATVANGAVTGFTVTAGGSGYTVAPAVTLAGGGGTGAAATATIANGVVTSIAIGNAGTAYTSPPTVTLVPVGAGATATATVNASGVITALTLTNGGANYTASPTVSFTGGGGTGATATATIANGVVTGIAIGNGGTGYPPPTVTKDTGNLAEQGTADTLIPQRLPLGTGGTLTYQWKKNGVAITGATAASLALTTAEKTESGAFGATTPRSFPLRVLLHVADDGTARLLSQVFMGRLAAAPNNLGLCTLEAALKQDEKATAHRYAVAHLPPNTVVASGSGTVALGQTLVRTIPLAYDAATNPFVHAYHPDHDNRNARFDAKLPAGVESPTIARVCNFTFTRDPIAGANAQGWGSTVLGGTYAETITGLHKRPITVTGTFELRRASELGAITIP
jgi:hypothetical protein